jgi:hypothetical protein
VIEWFRIVRGVFYLDGTLRDIYVLGTSEHDWQALLDYLRVSPYPVEYFLEGLDSEMASLPEQVSEIFAPTRELWPLLYIDREQLGLACPFNGPEEIDFSLDPRDFQTEEQTSSLLDFMRTIGRVVNKPIILTGEHDDPQDTPLFRYDPTTNEDTWFPERVFCRGDSQLNAMRSIGQLIWQLAEFYRNLPGSVTLRSGDRCAGHIRPFMPAKIPYSKHIGACLQAFGHRDNERRVLFNSVRVARWYVSNVVIAQYTWVS